MLSKGGKSKNLGDTVIVFTANLPLETLIPHSLTPNLHLANIPNAPQT